MFTTALAAMTLAVLPSTAPRAAALSATDWRPGMIIRDEVFYNPSTMDATAVQNFLNARYSGCDVGYTCVRDYRATTPSKPAESGLCNGYAGVANETAAQIVAKVAQSCGINPQALLALVQKESGLLTDRNPDYRQITGFGCPDSTGCDAAYYGFFNQVYLAARQFRVYRLRPTSFGYVAGRTNSILYSPNAACGRSAVYIENQATAGLYNYTPYQPNAAALGNLYGAGDGCSTYGNRNFWVLFNNWFGPTVAAQAPIRQPGAFSALSPSRVLDTRLGVGAASAPVPAGGTVRLQVTGRGGVPVSGAGAVVLNLTVTDPQGAGFITAWPDGAARPTASNVNFVAGQTVPNLVSVPVGAGGVVDLYNGSTGSVQLVADVNGWYAGGAATAAGSFTPLTPARILDTRAGAPAGPGQTVAVQVTGRGGVPASGVSAVALNVTVTDPQADGFVTAYPAGGSRPLASNLNFSAGQTVPNAAIVRVGAGGGVDLVNGSAGSAHLVLDVSGYFLAGTATQPGMFVPLTPQRVLDTRDGTGSACACAVASGGTLRLPVPGTSGPVGGVVLNVTVTQPQSAGYLTAYPDGGSQPTASNVNFLAGQTVPNLAVVGTGPGPVVDLFNGSNGGTTDVVADLSGYYVGG